MTYNSVSPHGVGSDSRLIVIPVIDGHGWCSHILSRRLQSDGRSGRGQRREIGPRRSSMTTLASKEGAFPAAATPSLTMPSCVSDDPQATWEAALQRVTS